MHVYQIPSAFLNSKPANFSRFHAAFIQQYLKSDRIQPPLIKSAQAFQFTGVPRRVSKQFDICTINSELSGLTNFMTVTGFASHTLVVTIPNCDERSWT